MTINHLVIDEKKFILVTDCLVTNNVPSVYPYVTCLPNAISSSERWSIRLTRVTPHVRLQRKYQEKHRSSLPTFSQLDPKSDICLRVFLQCQKTLLQRVMKNGKEDKKYSIPKNLVEKKCNFYITKISMRRHLLFFSYWPFRRRLPSLESSLKRRQRHCFASYSLYSRDLTRPDSDSCISSSIWLFVYLYYSWKSDSNSRTIRRIFFWLSKTLS